MRAVFILVSAGFWCLLSTGCASVMTGAGPNQTVKIASNPRGAKIYVDGDYKGVTPLGVAMTRGDQHTLRLEMDGYQTRERQIKSGWNPWQAGNVIIGGVIGISIDFLDGSWQWLGGPVNERLVRNLAPSLSAPEPGLASSRGRSPAAAPLTPAPAQHPPVLADDYAARGGRATPAAPRPEQSDTGYEPTRLPPRRQAAPQQ